MAEIKLFENDDVIVWGDSGPGWSKERHEWKRGPQLHEAQMHVKLAAALAAVENAAETQANWAALTPVQKDEAARRTALAVCKLARLTLGRLEAS